MNTQKPQALPDGWEALLADRWERGKVQKESQWVYTIWERIQIRGKGENPETLTLYVIGMSTKWTKAGILKRKGDRWVYEPVRTSETPEILKATIIHFLTPKPRKTAQEIVEESQKLTDFSKVQKAADKLTDF